jgi:hypothetical protein
MRLRIAAAVSDLRESLASVVSIQRSRLLSRGFTRA